MMPNVIKYLHENNYDNIQGSIKAHDLPWNHTNCDYSQYPQGVPIEVFYDVYWVKCKPSERWDHSVHKIKGKVDPKELECLKDIQQRIEHLMEKEEKRIEDLAHSLSADVRLNDESLTDGTWWVARDGSYDIELGQLYYLYEIQTEWAIVDDWKPIKEKSER